MKELVLFVGPPGSGKSTAAHKPPIGFGARYINQDSQGKEGHLIIFKQSIEHGLNIVVDRMNFSKEQRNRYLLPAKKAGYKTKIVVLHENYETCFKRCLARKNHETIKSPKDARNALEFFFKKYERVEDNEADKVIRIWPEYGSEYANWLGKTVKVPKRRAIICDLDGTLCNIEHRLHFVRGEGKKDWKAFFNGLYADGINKWCHDLLQDWAPDVMAIVLCSGRPDSHKRLTESWLDEHGVKYDNLFMRHRSDFRSDDIVKEQILDFEILTRYEPYFMIDDRQQVVDMWRRRGYVCLQCDKGDF